MAQTYTSKATSINRSKLPAVYNKAIFSAPFVFDYGCGKYTDHIRQHLNGQGRELFPYDPYNQPKEINDESLQRMNLCSLTNIPVDVVCSNVLNVIDSEYEIETIAQNIMNIVTITNGFGFVTVYEGDRSGIGRATGTDQYQRNEPLKSYLKYFSGNPKARVTIKKGMIFIFKGGQ